ncbi:MAG TPA: SDR family oxidoreductase [Bacteroidales bacterium]|nr:SDR family oxidoreductase [Bacteroidales bacterium]
MEHIVITGGSRGIGKAMALEFMRKGCTVTISGRNPETLKTAEDDLVNNSETGECHSYVCDVTRQEDLEMLWDKASSVRPVNIWINNAGVNHINYRFHELEYDVISSVIDTNIKGTAMGSKVAITGMLNQGFGAIYNMEGFGSDGRKIDGMSIYGTSKNGVRYLTRSLIKEYRDAPLLIGSISPGMVVTDMLLEPLRTAPEKNRESIKIFHTLADTAERVTPWLVNHILGNKRNGARIAWLTPWKITWRFFSGIFKKRKVKGLPDYP